MARSVREAGLLVACGSGIRTGQQRTRYKTANIFLTLCYTGGGSATMPRRAGAHLVYKAVQRLAAEGGAPSPCHANSGTASSDLEPAPSG